MKKSIITLLLFCCFIYSESANAQDPFIGEIRMFAGNFAPRGWAKCEGQLLAISQNSALFSILGTTYGGDGRTTFALPDLRGRVPMHYGSGPGLSSYTQGQSGGSETNMLAVANLPAHNHSINAVTADGNTSVPGGNLPAGTKLLDKEYSDATATTTMNATMVSSTGGGQAVNNMQPYLTVTYIIALQGIYPSRN
jgi:microcystin-dependent protein